MAKKKKVPPVLAVFSLKGGVGKTTTAVSLAYLAAEQGRQVLLWDLDPQGAASYCLRIRPKVKGAAGSVVAGGKDLGPHIKETDTQGLDLMPADFSYRKLDAMLARQKRPRRLLGRALEELVKTRLDGYDLVVLDCPPGPSLVSDSVLRMADLVVVPMIPTPLSLRAQTQLEAYCRRAGLSARQILTFFMMVDRRKALHRQTLQSWAGARGTAVEVPYSALVESMALRREPYPQFGGEAPPAKAMRALWEQAQLRLF